MKMDRAISIKVNARKRCTAESYSIDAKSQPPGSCAQVRLRLERAPVHRSKGDSLSPPIRVGTISKKWVHQRVVEFTGPCQIIAKFGNRLRPVISPS
jgi:hypothetical protein